MVGYDLDGTLCTETPYNKFEQILYKLFGEAYGRYRKKYEKPIRRPKGVYVIITSRHIKNTKRTEKWLRRYSYKPYKVYICGSLQAKAEIINRTGVIEYYENNTISVDYLDRHCPATEITRV